MDQRDRSQREIAREIPILKDGHGQDCPEGQFAPMRAASLAVLQHSAGRAHASAWETIGGHRQLAVNHMDDRDSQTSIPNLTPDTDFAAPSELNWEVCTYRKCSR